MTILAVMILAAAGYLAIWMTDLPDMAFCIAAGWALAFLCYSCGHEVRHSARHGTKIGGSAKERA